MERIQIKHILNPFVPNVPVLCPLKTSENRKVFSCFQGVEKGCIGNEWVKFDKMYILSKNSQETELCNKKLFSSYYLSINSRPKDPSTC